MITFAMTVLTLMTVAGAAILGWLSRYWWTARQGVDPATLKARNLGVAIGTVAVGTATMRYDDDGAQDEAPGSSARDSVDGTADSTGSRAAPASLASASGGQSDSGAAGAGDRSQLAEAQAEITALRARLGPDADKIASADENDLDALRAEATALRQASYERSGSTDSADGDEVGSSEIDAQSLSSNTPESASGTGDRDGSDAAKAGAGGGAAALSDDDDAPSARAAAASSDDASRAGAGDVSASGSSASARQSLASGPADAASGSGDGAGNATSSAADAQASGGGADEGASGGDGSAGRSGQSAGSDGSGNAPSSATDAQASGGGAGGGASGGDGSAGRAGQSTGSGGSGYAASSAAAGATGAASEAASAAASDDPDSDAANSSETSGNDLTAIRGIGAALQDQLNERGITTYADLAALSPEDQAALGEALGFTGRVEREDWVAQASELMDSPAASARPTGGRETRLGVLANAGRALGSLDDSEKAEALSEDEAAAMRLIESGDFVADDSNRPTVLMDAAPAGGGDDLKVIKGVGPKLEGLLNGLGVYQFSQIAAFSATDIAWVDSKLSFKGRIVRDRWVDQARDLAG